MGDEVRLDNIDLLIDELNTLKANKGWHFLGIKMDRGYLTISPVGFINSHPVHIRPTSFKIGVYADCNFIVEEQTPWGSWVGKHFTDIGDCMMHIKSQLEDIYAHLGEVYVQEVEDFLAMGFEVVDTRLVYSEGMINYTIRVAKDHKFNMSIEKIDTMTCDMRLIKSFEFNEMSEVEFKEVRDDVKTLLLMENKVYQTIKNIKNTLRTELGIYKSKIGSHIE